MKKTKFLFIFIDLILVVIILNKIFESNSTKTNNILKYINLHNYIIESNEKATKKFVFFIPHWNGYGNKLYGLLSAFTIAILTDSAIRIQWDSIDDYFYVPLKNVFDLFDSSSQLSFDNKNESFKIIAQDENNHFKYEKKLNLILNENIHFNKSRLFLVKDIRPYFFTLCSRPVNYEKLLSYSLVKEQTIQDAKQALKQNVTESEKIEKLYKIGFEVGSKIINNFWLLKSPFLNDIDKFYEKEFKDFFIIGMQFRFAYLPDEQVDMFVNCANYIQKINNLNYVKWFVTADNEKIFDILKKYSYKIIKGIGKIGHLTYDENTAYRTFFDHELLSRSNEIIMTGGSSYGFTAAIKKGIMPYYIEGFRANRESCLRATFDKAPRNIFGYSSF